MANVLATDYMIPVYNRKVVVFNEGSETIIRALTHDEVDNAINYGEIFRDYASLAHKIYNVSQIRTDDNQPLVLGRDTIDSSQVPGELTYSITVDQQFVKVND